MKTNVFYADGEEQPDGGAQQQEPAPAEPGNEA